jgi:hypothetical protein
MVTPALLLPGQTDNTPEARPKSCHDRPEQYHRALCNEQGCGDHSTRLRRRMGLSRGEVHSAETEAVVQVCVHQIPLLSSEEMYCSP